MKPMKLNRLLLMTLAGLQGCQFNPSINGQLDTAECYLPDTQLVQFLDDEHRFINADQATRKALIQSVQNNPPRLINLYSIAGNSAHFHTEAQQLFQNLPLLPDARCPSDRYLYLRFRQSQANLRQLNEMDSAKAQLVVEQKRSAKLQSQIDELTRIEHAITRQREEH